MGPPHAPDSPDVQTVNLHIARVRQAAQLRSEYSSPPRCPPAAIATRSSGRGEAVLLLQLLSYSCTT